LVIQLFRGLLSNPFQRRAVPFADLLGFRKVMDDVHSGQIGGELLASAVLALVRRDRERLGCWECRKHLGLVEQPTLIRTDILSG